MSIMTEARGDTIVCASLSGLTEAASAATGVAGLLSAMARDGSADSDRLRASAELIATALLDLSELHGNPAAGDAEEFGGALLGMATLIRLIPTAVRGSGDRLSPGREEAIEQLAVVLDGVSGRVQSTIDIDAKSMAARRAALEPLQPATVEPL